MSLSGTTVLVTGAGGGSGETTARAFLHAGYPVIAGDLQVPVWETEYESLLTRVKMDISQEDQVNDVVRFKESSVRAMGCNTTGVRGIRLGEGDKVVSLIVPRGDGAILTATQNGYGKRTAVAEYPTKSRATKGVISIKVTERNGLVVGAVQVDDCDQIMMITDAGTLVRTRVSEISIVGRNTQGVILIRTAEDENVVGLQRVAEPVDEEDLDTIDGSAAEGDDEIAPEVDVDDEPEEE